MTDCLDLSDCLLRYPYGTTFSKIGFGAIACPGRQHARRIPIHPPGPPLPHSFPLLLRSALQPKDTAVSPSCCNKRRLTSAPAPAAWHPPTPHTQARRWDAVVSAHGGFHPPEIASRPTMRLRHAGSDLPPTGTGTDERHLSPYPSCFPGSGPPSGWIHPAS